ncbi:hypothetical protein [Streptomyces sp. SID3343]|uniref:hypothetical protein n=1 Tax=Streptomyces sp. SID3343 TaxID=2690260 RepID=UPI00136CBAD1|nr:hypothetical protein [Streptomyces sp. SID3343]MYV98462.1 hypothetical protein [Streptomyces sp. SID3343]
MKVLNSAGRTALAGCVVLALSAVVSTDAYAASGRFTYDRENGTSRIVFNPPNGECIAFDAPAVGVDNATDTDSRVFAGSICDGASEVVPKNTGVTWGTFRPKSVRFG